VATESVLIVDDDSDLRAMMSQLFLSKGAACIGVGSLDELIAAGTAGLSCRLAILDVNLGPGRPSGVDAYRWLSSQSFSGRVVFLTGHARSFPGLAEAHALGVPVLEKPVSIDRLLRLLDDGSPPAGG
jgi:DNA-binding NtrC family response regulator